MRPLMISLTRLALVVGFIALPLAGYANQVCDFEHRCYEDKPLQHYHMDLAHPDAETPPPAPQYPQIRRPEWTRHRRSDQTPAKGAICSRSDPFQTSSRRSSRFVLVSPDEERAIRERANRPFGAGAGQQGDDR